MTSEVKQGTESESCPIALSQLLKWVKVFPSSGLPDFMSLGVNELSQIAIPDLRVLFFFIIFYK